MHGVTTHHLHLQGYGVREAGRQALLSQRGVRAGTGHGVTREALVMSSAMFPVIKELIIALLPVLSCPVQ